MKDADHYLTKYGVLRPVVTRKYFALMSDLFMSSYAELVHYNTLFFVDYYTRTGYINGVYYYGSEAASFGDLIIAKEDKEKGFVMKVFSNIYEYGEKLLAYTEELKSTDYSNKTTTELLSYFKKFSEMYREYSISLMGYNIQYPVEKRLRELVKNRDNPEEDLSVLSFPKKDNFAALEQISLFKIGSLIREKNINKFEDLSVEILDKIQEHIKEFGWINTRGGQANPWTKKEIFERIMHLEGGFSQKLVDLKNHKINSQEKTEQLLKELNADEEIINLIEIAKELVYFRTYRTDYLTKTFSNVKPLLEEIAKRRNLSYKEILSLRVHEILDEKHVDKEEIEKRMIGYALVSLEPNKIKFSSEPETIKEIKDKFFRDHEATSEIKGRSAFIGQGKVQGRVKIVTNKSDLVKVESGDILVSPMTTPDFVMAMEKAAAFVTDEGGITCHAAIVAREMKKPCIIGTQTATKSLKDNDLVEVDSEKGIVKIIK